MFTDTIVKKYVVEQFEEDDALVENAATRQVYRIPKEMLPGGTQEGSVFEIRYLKAESDLRDEKIRRLIEGLQDHHIADAKEANVDE